MVNIIRKKKEGLELTTDEIQFVIDGFVKDSIPDYQISSLLMAICFQGLNGRETSILTEAMMRSGEIIDLSSIPGIKVDKHSTGGVGDKTTLILGPLVAAAGVPVAKMSGRGLGHTGGTLDKLESISGIQVEMSKEAFIDKIRKHGIAVCGQNATLVPADKKLYALRDVTGTVDNVSLIASSVMSKKLACGADAMVIDIKVGEGAYMKNVEEAEKLAAMIIAIGQNMGREVRTVLTSMREPLGYTIGNSLEVVEAVETLKGLGPDDLTELCLELGAHMLILGKIEVDHSLARKKLRLLIDSGAALEKFKEMVIAQNGDIGFVDNPELLPRSKYSFELKSKKEGYVSHLDAENVGLASLKLGAGRVTKTSVIDYGAGIILKKKIGDKVEVNETVAILFSNKESNFEHASVLLEDAFSYSPHKVEEEKLILKVIS